MRMGGATLSTHGSPPESPRGNGKLSVCMCVCCTKVVGAVGVRMCGCSGCCCCCCLLRGSMMVYILMKFRLGDDRRACIFVLYCDKVHLHSLTDTRILGSFYLFAVCHRVYLCICMCNLEYSSFSIAPVDDSYSTHTHRQKHCVHTFQWHKITLTQRNTQTHSRSTNTRERSVVLLLLQGNPPLLTVVCVCVCENTTNAHTFLAKYRRRSARDWGTHSHYTLTLLLHKHAQHTINTHR